MQELSMNILDIAQNSVRAGAGLCRIELREDTAQNSLLLCIADNGCGMDEEMVKRVTDPFFTSRKTRKVGLGLPFLKMAAEMTGGGLSIHSKLGQGTEIQARFTLGHIDLMPLGDLGATMAALCAGSPEMEFQLLYQRDTHQFLFDTKQLREILGEVPFSQPAVTVFIAEYVNEQMELVRQQHSEAARLPEE